MPVASTATDSGGDPAARVRAEVAQLRQGLDRLETVLRQIGTGTGESAPRSRPERYYQVLVDVYECGRHGTSSEAFTALGRARGYDARGLGGLFVGSRAPLVRRPGRVLLTTEGHRLVHDHLGAR